MVNGYRELNGVKLRGHVGASTQGGWMATLEELIRQRKEQLGLSFRKLGELAKEAGAPTEPNWSHLANKRIREFPKLRTIHALAKALEVTPEEVAQAALESLDLHAKPIGPIVQPGEHWLLVSLENLSPEDVADTRRRIAEISTRARDQNECTRGAPEAIQ